MMMKLSRFSALLLAGTILARCAGTTPTVINNNTVEQIQSTIAATCSALPTATAVASLVNAIYNIGPVVNIVAQAASDFCAAFNANKGAVRGQAAGVLVVRGVPMSWKRVKVKVR